MNLLLLKLLFPKSFKRALKLLGVQRRMWDGGEGQGDAFREEKQFMWD